MNVYTKSTSLPFVHLIGLLVSELIVGVFILSQGIVADGIYAMLALLNGSIAIAAMFSHQGQPFSIHKMILLFIFLFLIIANAMQHFSGAVVNAMGLALTSQEYRGFQLLVLMILIVYLSAYEYVFNKRKYITYHRHYTKPKDKALLLLSLGATVLVILHYRNNPAALLFRGTIFGRDSMPEQESSIAAVLLFGKVIRALPFSCYIWSKVTDSKVQTRVVLFLCMTICLFPTSLARNAAAAYWLPVVLVWLPIFWKRDWFVLIMLAGILLVFPFFDNFRNFSGEIKFDFGLNFDYLNTMNYDASQNFMLAMRTHLVSFGEQLLGVLLFFVPRSIWPGKPLGSGATLATQLHSSFTNISLPFFCEGYMNFGFLGVFLFTVLAGVIAAKGDKKYWYASNERDRKNYYPYYATLIGYAFYIMRGDLMSSYAYCLATLFDVLLVELLFYGRWHKEKVFYRQRNRK